MKYFREHIKTRCDFRFDRRAPHSGSYLVRIDSRVLHREVVVLLQDESIYLGTVELSLEPGDARI